ncbi:checkpoint protein Hus1/Mec3 [Cunninghamella echinulata]|nr:checkpoint protein Hus1/Mec3 [Cunninghamella echinulata]
MRFRAVLINPIAFHKIALTLEKFGPTCIICFAIDSIHFVKYHENYSDLRAWIKVDPHILFSGYRLESSYNNELSISIDLDSLVRATKVAQQSASTKIILRQKDGQPYLDWRISIENRIGSTNETSHQLDVVMVPSDRMQYLREPPILETPNAYILLPNLLSMKPIGDRLKSLSKFLTLSVNMNGKIKLSVETELAQVEAIYNNLENPVLNGHRPPADERDNFSSVCISTEDLVNFLNCYNLDPRNVVCAVTDQLCLAFYVYTNLNIHILPDERSGTIYPTETIFTCHMPVYTL